MHSGICRELSKMAETLTPTVRWAQTKDRIFLTIELSDVLVNLLKGTLLFILRNFTYLIFNCA